MKILKILSYLIGAVFFLALLSLGLLKYGQNELIKWSAQEAHLQEPVVISFPRGTSLESLGYKLSNRKIIDKPVYFKIWVKYFSDYSRFQAGQYRFEDKISPRSVAAKMISGDTYIPIVLQVAIPEGFTIKQIAARLVAKNVAPLQEIIKLSIDKEFLKKHNIPSTSLEGYLFPATYNFTYHPTHEEVFSRMIKTFWKKLPADYEEKVKESGLSLAQAVIFASLIELETPHDDEKPMVSEVIWRRYKGKARLGIDAAIIYGIPDYKGDIKFRHLRDKNNPYNTRIHRGLPPTPIGSPSTSSLLAVINPTNQKYYYYALDIENGNRHHFSKSLKEHNKYVRKLKKAGQRSRRK